jgi:transposase
VGLGVDSLSDDLGVGMSTLDKWITVHRDIEVVSKEDLDLIKENDRLRCEIRLLEEEREILKKATQFFAGPKK